MLRLDWETPRAWVPAVSRDLIALLRDHAHCEVKAAAAARALIEREPGALAIRPELEEIEAEELEHHALVLAELERRGADEGHFGGNPYVQGLLAGARKGGSRLLERLLIAALIEARSFERFQLLADHLEDSELVELYRGLLASEAGHRAFFVRAARQLFPAAEVESRLAALCAHEARLVAALPFASRMHSGPPA